FEFLGASLRPLRLCVERYVPSSPPSRRERRGLRREESQIRALRKILADFVGRQYARYRAETHPLTGVRRASREIKPFDPRAAMSDSTRSHEARGHHRIHALAVKVMPSAPFRRSSRLNNSVLTDMFAPPLFANYTFEEFSLCFCSALGD